MFKNSITVSLAMYDAEPVEDKTEDPGEGQEPKNKDGAPAVFTQEDVNKFMAEEKRKLVTKYTEKQAQLEGAYKEALANQSLSSEQRAQLETKLEDLQKTFRSKEQQLEHDKAQIQNKYQTEVKELAAKAELWETKYKTSMIDRDLQDAGIKNDAFDPEQISALLRPMTKAVEILDEEGNGTGDFHPMVDLQDIDTKTGEKIITRRTPTDAVKRMSELPKWGNLFKSNVVSGVGSGSATGSGLPGKGHVDMANMSPAQYMALRAKNPGALGLK